MGIERFQLKDKENVMFFKETLTQHRKTHNVFHVISNTFCSIFIAKLQTLFLKTLFLIFLSCILTLISLIPSAFAQTGNDYTFYRSYGQHNTSWDQYVKNGFEAYDRQDCLQTLEQLRLAISLRCEDPLVLYKLAVCSEKEEQLYTAIQYYKLAYNKLQYFPSAHPYKDSIYENYGRALFKNKSYDEALPLLEKASTTATPSFSVFYMTGFIHAKNQAWEKAFPYLEKAVQQDTSGVPPPVLAQVYLLVAQARAQKGEYSSAIKMIKQALPMRNDDPEFQAHANQLLSQWNKKQFEEQQKKMLLDFQGLMGEGKGEKAQPIINPAPPAASKLPPLHENKTSETEPPTENEAGNSTHP